MDNSNTDIVSETLKILELTENGTDTLIDDISKIVVDNAESSSNPSKKHRLTQCDKRDELYTELFEGVENNYIDTIKTNKKLKNAFFIVALTIFCMIISVSLFVIVVLTFKEPFNYSKISVIVGAITGIISSILVLPQIIAKYLFPSDEAENMLGFLEKMQANDANIRQQVLNVFKENSSLIVDYQDASILPNNSEPSDN